MKKVKVTKEQAKGLNQITTPQSAVKEHVGNWQLGNDLNALSLDELIRALYIGYEVEPEFKVGDWVVTKVTNHIGKITGFSSITKYYDIEGIQTDVIRHATPSEIAEEKERRFFAGHGRELWELKYKDILRLKSGLLFGDKARKPEKFVEIGELNKSYAGEVLDVLIRGNGWWPIDKVKKYYKVAVFAKDRLDVKTNG